MIPAQAVEAAANHLFPNWDTAPAEWKEYFRRRTASALEASLPYLQSRAIEELAEARNEDDTLFIFSWGQRDWMRRHAVEIRTEPTP